MDGRDRDAGALAGGPGADHGAGACLNCGTRLTGAFCHACGQGAHVHRSLGAIGHDVLHGAFHFEGRIFRTLPLLVRDPGGLTRRYIAGERVRFVPPLALFLFCVFLMFAALHAVGPEAGSIRVPMNAQARAEQLSEIDAEIARQRAEIARTPAAAPTAQEAAATAAAARATLGTLTAARKAMADGTVKSGGGLLAEVPDHATGWMRLDHGIARVRDNPALAFYEFQASAYKYSWALILISTPFVALLFLWRRRFTLFDHAVFATYSLDFMLLLVTACTIAGALGLPAPVIASALVIVPPLHMFAQLRGAYGLRRRSALWRTAALLVFAWAALMAFLALLLTLGLMA